MNLKHRYRRMARTAALMAMVAMLPSFAAPLTAYAAGPSALPDAYWWHRSPSALVAVDPLEALTGPVGVRSAFEWAPIYDGPHASRIRQDLGMSRFVTAMGDWRCGVEIEQGSAIGAGGESDWNARLATPSTTSGAFGISRTGARAAYAGALSLWDGHVGGALSATVQASPGIRGSLSWSRRSAGGTLFARWDDNGVAGIVDAEGTWAEAHARGAVSVRLPVSTVATVHMETFDRTPHSAEASEWLERTLVWRAQGVSLEGQGRLGRWSAAYVSGEGREGLRVERNGAPYARADAPLRSSDVTLEYDPAALPLKLRAWSGTWSQGARGNVSMWAFDPLLGLAGTHRVAHAEAALTHHGFSIDRGGAAEYFLDPGVALWRLAPKADYSTWRAAFFGIGREDESSGESEVQALTLLGLRAALQVRAAGVRIRVEGVQWVPIHIERESSASTGGGGSGGGIGSSDSGGASTGGSIVRVSVTSL